jgi:hypothetical protein
MAGTDDGYSTSKSAGDEVPPVDITVYAANEWGRGEADLAAENETPGTDGLPWAVAEAEAAIARVRDAGTYDEGRLPASGNSLWWPDRSAQVVQATQVGPQEVGEFLRARVGEPHDQLRIESVVGRTPSQFEAKAQLHVRPSGWRGVTLTIYPTPSANLTVIEMLPRRAWMPQTTRYLAAGVPAITELTDQIEAAES